MKTSLVLSIAMWLGGLLYGQDLTARKDSVVKTVSSVGTRLSASCLGSILYPGLSAGWELPFRTAEIHKTRENGERIVHRERYFAGDLSLYHHKGYHTNCYLLGSINLKRTADRGFFTLVSVGTGVSRTFFGATTYLVNANGDIEQEKLSGHWYFALSVAAAIGKDFQYSKLNWPGSIFFKPSALVMMPYASTIYWRPSLELGIKYRLDHVLVHAVPNTAKYKRK